MMFDLWRTHIAWRFARTASSPDTPSGSNPGGSRSVRLACAKCHRSREDARFKLCKRCRVMAANTAKRRRSRLARAGLCAKCGGSRNGDHIICGQCRASTRAHYHARGKAH